MRTPCSPQSLGRIEQHEVFQNPTVVVGGPVPWYLVDEERGWVVCEWRNRMRDPGNGEISEEKNYTRLKYAGNMQWSFEEDIYNPLRMRTMISLWLHTRDKCAAQGLAMPDPAATDIQKLHVDVQDNDTDNRWSRDEIEDAVKHFDNNDINIILCLIVKNNTYVIRRLMTVSHFYCFNYFSPKVKLNSYISKCVEVF